MDAVDIIREALRAERKKLGLGVLAFEKEMGFPSGGLRAIIREDNPQVPSLEKAQKAAKALGLELYIGPVRPTDPSASSTIAGALRSPVVLDFLTAAGVDGNVGMQLDGDGWSGQLLMSPKLARALSASLARRALEIEEPE